MLLLNARPMALLLLLPLLIIVSACASSGGFPPLADLRAVTEPAPIPGDDIVTSALASEHHNAAIEAHGARVLSAGERLCRFYLARGMKGLSCPASRDRAIEVLPKPDFRR